MKNINEQKQDLLLDALSCIDDDILEQGLALRDGTTPVAASAPRKQAPEAAYLFELSAPPPKPPKKSLWRVLSVVAAACLLICALPLSMWMVANLVKDDDASPDAAETQGHQFGIEDKVTAEDMVPEEIPGAPSDGNHEADAPVDTADEKIDGSEMSTDAPVREPGENAFESVTEAETAFEPHELVWSTLSKTDSMAEYTAQAHNGTTVTLIGSTDGIEGIPLPAEDEMALQTVGQWLLSIYTLDYGDHFPLFYESFVQGVFIKEAVGHRRSYQNAILYMDGVAAQLLPIEEVYLILHLVENTLLTGEELEAFCATRPSINTSWSFDPGWITAVRRVRVSGGIEIDGFQPTVSALDEAFYLYECEGRWYLDESLMEDDLSIDLLGTGKADTGFYKTETATGTVVSVRGNYLYLDTGDAFRMDGAKILTQTDGGEWQEAVIRVGDTVTVSHYSLTLEGLLSQINSEHMDEDTEWTLSTATRIDIIG